MSSQKTPLPAPKDSSAADDRAPAPVDERHLVELFAQSVADALYVLDAQGAITFMNPAAEKMFGWPQDELHGKVLHDVIHYKHPDGSPFPVEQCPLRGVVRDGYTLADHEDVFLHRDGTWLPVCCTNAPIRIDGRIVGAALVVRELTQRRRLEAALHQRALAQEEINRRKDEFIAMLAHELRNPLGAVSNAVALLRLREGSSEVRRRALDIIERQVRHQARLVDDLLDMSRLTQGKITLKRARLDLRALVVTETEDRRRDFEQAGLSLSVQLPAEPLWMEGDAIRLAQVLGNLMNNAAKFTNRGGSVEVSLALGEGPDERTAVVTVRDTGVGIDPLTLERLFEPFTQADHSLDRTLGGLGLGLAMVRGLVALHGGTVRARSDGLMRGAEFSVILPIEGEIPRAEEARREAPSTAPASRRVLVVEDNQDAADSLRDMIELFGHQADVAYNGIKGVEVAQRLKPDIILCDVGLPGLDGYGVARALRADAALSGTLLVAVSGYGQEEDRSKSRAAGFDLHLVKPVDADDLERLLANPPDPARP